MDTENTTRCRIHSYRCASNVLTTRSCNKKQVPLRQMQVVRTRRQVDTKEKTTHRQQLGSHSSGPTHATTQLTTRRQSAIICNVNRIGNCRVVSIRLQDGGPCSSPKKTDNLSTQLPKQAKGRHCADRVGLQHGCLLLQERSVTMVTGSAQAPEHLQFRAQHSRHFHRMDDAIMRTAPQSWSHSSNDGAL